MAPQQERAMPWVLERRIDKDEYILVGRLGRTRGVKGEIWVVPLTDFPDRFVGLKKIYLRESDDWKVYAIEISKMVSGKPVMKFQGIDNKEEVARLTNRELAVTREDLVELPGDQFYVFDLAGCQVFDQSDEPVGELEDVRRYPASDLYVIRDHDGNTLLLPAVRTFVLDVDLERRRITIDKSGLYQPSEDETGR